jgi:hypothetical protein
MKKLWLTLFVLLAAAMAPKAHAYLDPASGSMVLQLIVGGIAGAAVVLKLYWHKFLGLFGIKKKDSDDSLAADPVAMDNDES